MFNDALRQFKAKYGEREKLWELMVTGKVGLLCKGDFDDEDCCQVTAEEAAEFLAKQKEATQIREEDEDSDDDDMDDLM